MEVFVLLIMFGSFAVFISILVAISKMKTNTAENNDGELNEVDQDKDDQTTVQLSEILSGNTTKDSDQSAKKDRSEFEQVLKSTLGNRNRNKQQGRQLEPRELEPNDKEVVTLDDHQLEKQTLEPEEKDVQRLSDRTPFNKEKLELLTPNKEDTPITSKKMKKSTVSKNRWRDAIIYKEILDKPKSLR